MPTDRGMKRTIPWSSESVPPIWRWVGACIVFLCLPAGLRGQELDAPHRDIVLLGAGLSAALTDRIVFHLNYDAEVARGNCTVHTVNVEMKVGFS